MSDPTVETPPVKIPEITANIIKVYSQKAREELHGAPAWLTEGVSDEELAVAAFTREQMEKRESSGLNDPTIPEWLRETQEEIETRIKRDFDKQATGEIDQVVFNTTNEKWAGIFEHYVRLCLEQGKDPNAIADNRDLFNQAKTLVSYMNTTLNQETEAPPKHIAS